MERNELRLSNKRRHTENDFKIQNQERKPRKQQKRLLLTKELNNAMQDRQWKSPTIQEDLESIRKFSILRCIRERVFEELSKLPLLSLECLVQKERDIDGLIRRNLLKDRKVRFSADDEYEGEAKIPKTEDEIEKENILEEMDVVLKVLGNDSQNRLIIENFDLLEQRIERVEQRLSGLVRKLPYRNDKLNLPIKIDINHVRQDLENFVNKFNQVFSKDYGIIPKTSVFKCVPKQTLSSTHRLKFQILSRIMEEDTNLRNNFQEFKTTESIKPDIIETVPEICATKQFSSEADAQQSVEKLDLQTEQPPLKAVDSLITLRERFKSQSLKWLKIKSEKKNEPPKVLAQTRIEELYLSAERKRTEDIYNPSLKTQELESSKEKEALKIDLEKEQTEQDVKETGIKHIEINSKPEIIEETPYKQEQNKNLLKFDQPKESINAFKDPNINAALKSSKEANFLDKATKSVQTMTKMKKKKLKRRPKLLQPEEAKEIVVQYVNKKVLQNSNSTAEFEEWKAMKDKEFMKNEKDKESKIEKIDKNQLTKTKSNNKQPKDPNTSNCQKVVFQTAPKDLLTKKQENSTNNNTKRYKKIFLFKIPKSNSKQQTKVLQKKLELNDSNEHKEPIKKVTEKQPKKTSLIKLFPKTSKIKPLKEDKSKERKLQKPGIKTIISNDSIDKVPTIEQIRKLRSTWIYAEDQGELVQKRLDDFTVYPDPTLNNNMKNRKTIYNIKNKKN